MERKRRKEKVSNNGERETEWERGRKSEENKEGRYKGVGSFLHLVN